MRSVSGGLVVTASARLGSGFGDAARGHFEAEGAGASMDVAGAGSVASLAANVAMAEPSLTGRVIAAWPSLALRLRSSC